jgi:hypothetical protein
VYIFLVVSGSFFFCFVYDAHNALTICVVLCWTEGNTQNAGPPADELQKLIELGEAPAAVTAGAHSADPPLRRRPSDRLYYYNSLPFSHVLLRSTEYDCTANYQSIIRKSLFFFLLFPLQLPLAITCTTFVDDINHFLLLPQRCELV